jgi:hypothetical protein
MLAYQVRPRVFRTDGTPFPGFPLTGDVRFHLGPQQPFGVAAGGGRTTVKAVAAHALFNANNGAHFIEASIPLQPLDVTLQAPDRVVSLHGSVLTVSQSFDSLHAVSELTESIYFAVRMLLAVEFGDPPFVERVEGVLGGVAFRWELKHWNGRFVTTSQQRQEHLFARSWERLYLLSTPNGRRLLAALHYFHVAARLARVASVAGEFLPEVILNLSKVLEVLFPPGGGGKTRDAVRAGLVELGFTEEEIERDYIPAMALRNEVDVGHVDLSLFKPDHLELIHGYTERAETAFRQLLARVLDRVEGGAFSVPDNVPAPATGAALQVVERLRKSTTSSAA